MKQAQYIEIDEEGNKLYYKDREMKILHRLDGPAVVLSSGIKFWYVNDELHRTDGPAIEYANGDKQWWINGKLHRVNGPAAEYVSGCKSWYIDGNYITEEEFKLQTAPEIVLTMDQIAAKLGIEVSKLKIVKEH